MAVFTWKNVQPSSKAGIFDAMTRSTAQAAQAREGMFDVIDAYSKNRQEDATNQMMHEILQAGEDPTAQQAVFSKYAQHGFVPQGKDLVDLRNTMMEQQLKSRELGIQGQRLDDATAERALKARRLELEEQQHKLSANKFQQQQELFNQLQRAMGDVPSTEGSGALPAPISPALATDTQTRSMISEANKQLANRHLTTALTGDQTEAQFAAASPVQQRKMIQQAFADTRFTPEQIDAATRQHLADKGLDPEIADASVARALTKQLQARNMSASLSGLSTLPDADMNADMKISLLDKVIKNAASGEGSQLNQQEMVELAGDDLVAAYRDKISSMEPVANTTTAGALDRKNPINEQAKTALENVINNLQIKHPEIPKNIRDQIENDARLLSGWDEAKKLQTELRDREAKVANKLDAVHKENSEAISKVKGDFMNNAYTKLQGIDNTKMQAVTNAVFKQAGYLSAHPELVAKAMDTVAQEDTEFFSWLGDRSDIESIATGKEDYDVIPEIISKAKEFLSYYGRKDLGIYGANEYAATLAKVTKLDEAETKLRDRAAKGELTAAEEATVLQSLGLNKDSPITAISSTLIDLRKNKDSYHTPIVQKLYDEYWEAYRNR